MHVCRRVHSCMEKRKLRNVKTSLFAEVPSNRKILELKSIRYQMLTLIFLISTANLMVVRLFHRAIRKEIGRLFICAIILQNKIFMFN